MSRQRFLYARLRHTMMLFAIIVLTGLAVMLWHGARHPISYRGVPAEIFSLFSWVLLATTFYLGCSGVRTWFRSRRDPKFVELDDLGASIPLYSSKAGFLRVPYARILRVAEQDIPNEGITLVILTLDGESRLRPDNFATSALYSKFKRALTSNWQAAVAKAPAATTANSL